MQITTLTTKGQVTIPKKIRDELGLKPGDKVIFEKDKKAVKIKPAPDFFSFKGALKEKRLPSDKEIEEIAAKEAVKRYLKTFR